MKQTSLLASLLLTVALPAACAVAVRRGPEGDLRAPNRTSEPRPPREQQLLHHHHAGHHRRLLVNYTQINVSMAKEVAEGFPHLPPRSSWESQLQQAARRSSSKPCDADILVASFGLYMGLGARVANFVNEVLTAVYGNYSIAICNSSSSLASSVSYIWTPHFQNLPDLPVCSTDEPACMFPEHDRAANDDPWEAAWIGARLTIGLKAVDRGYTEELKRFIYQKLFTYNAETQRHVDGTLDAVGLDSSTRYVGVHVRHGDKKTEATPLAEEAYAEEAEPYINVLELNTTVQKILLQMRRRNISTVFLASDDALARGRLESALTWGLQREVRVLEQSRGPEEAYSDRIYEDSEGVLLPLLTDVEALRRSEVFIGTASSSVGRLVYFLRGAEQTSVSLDDKGDFLKPT